MNKLLSMIQHLPITTSGPEEDTITDMIARWIFHNFSTTNERIDGLFPYNSEDDSIINYIYLFPNNKKSKEEIKKK